MSAPSIIKVIPKDGTSYDVTNAGATNIQQKYQIVLSRPLAPGELITTFIGGTASVPAIGTEHPNRPGYYAAKYSISQPRGAGKNTLDLTLTYSPEGPATDVILETNTDSLITDWGWDDGTSSRDLVNSVDQNGTPVVNSAGDPFETAPQVETPAPSFTKVVKFKTRRDYWDYMCKVNQAAMTIGGVSCPARTLLCTVSERLLIGDEVWPYQYTIRLRYRSNKVMVNGTLTEIGWDVGVVDAGMREIDQNTGELKLIQVLSKETNQLATVTSPELLDGQGHAITRGSSSSQSATILVFQAYERASFPSWFTSAPGNNVPPPSNSSSGNNGGNS